MKTCNFLIFVISLLALNKSGMAAGVTVSKWSLYEIELQASGKYANPYTQTGVQAVFTGPGKQQQTVKGFWNGNNSFVVRFAPVFEGTWTYITQSVDEGLNGKKGSFKCIKASSGQHGFLRRDENYRYHFIWDDGTRYFMMGQTYYGIMANAMAGDRWKEAIDGSRRMGMNKVRMQVNAEKEDPKVAYPAASPFADTTFNNLNIPYFKKLDEVVQYMQAKGVVADLILFRAFGTLLQDERYARYVLARYAVYTNVMYCLVNEWNYTPKNQAYWNHIGKLIEKEDPWMFNGKLQRLLSVHQQTRIDFQFFDQQWLTHAIIQYGVRNGQNVQGDEWSKEQNKAKYVHGDQWGNACIIYNLGRNIPVVNDEYGYIGEPEDRSATLGKSSASPVALTREKHRQILWGIYIAGGYGSAGDKYQYYKGGKSSSVQPSTVQGDNDGKPYFSANWYQAKEYDDIRHLVDFFTTKGLQYWKMVAHNQLKVTGERVYILAEPAKQYVIYAATGGIISINLAAGNYLAKRYNPATGKEEKIGSVKGGMQQKFLLPPGEDGVIYLTAEAKNK